MDLFEYMQVLRDLSDSDGWPTDVVWPDVL